MYFWKHISVIRNAESFCCFSKRRHLRHLWLCCKFAGRQTEWPLCTCFFNYRSISWHKRRWPFIPPGALFTWAAPVKGSDTQLMLLWHCERSVMNTSLSVLLFGQKTSGDHWPRPNDTSNWWTQQLKEDVIAERRVTPRAFLRANHHKHKGFAPAFKPA